MRMQELKYLTQVFVLNLAILGDPFEIEELCTWCAASAAQESGVSARWRRSVRRDERMPITRG